MTVEKVDPETLWADSRLEIERNTDKSWAKLRVKKSWQNGRQYFDILMGIKGRKGWHTHLGIYLNGELFLKEYRGQIGAISRQVDSANNGRLEDKTVVIDPYKKPLTDFKFRQSLNSKTREVSVAEFEIIDRHNEPIVDTKNLSKDVL